MPSVFFVAETFFVMEVNDAYVKLMVVKNGRNGSSINKYERLELPAGTVSRGVVADAGFLERVVTRFLTGVNARRAAVVVKCHARILRFAKFPAMKRRDLHKSVESSYDECFPVNKPDYVFGYNILPGASSDAHVLLAALPLTLSESYVALFKRLPLRLEVVDVFENAVSGFFYSYDKGDYLVVFSLETRIAVAFFAGGVLRVVHDCAVTEDLLGLNLILGSLPGRADKAYLLDDVPTWLTDFLGGLYEIVPTARLQDALLFETASASIY